MLHLVGYVKEFGKCITYIMPKERMVVAGLQ